MNLNHSLRLLAFSFFATGQLLAHEGHDHGAPGVMKAPHGGFTQKGKNIDIELVQDSDSVAIYGLTPSSSTMKPSDFQISGSVEFPKKKPETLTFSTNKDHHRANLSFVGSDGKLRGHRAKVIVQVTPAGKGPETFTFQLEPQN